MSPKTFDEYTIIHPAIAKGGSSVVHEALSPDGKTKVAIKVLNRASIELRTKVISLEAEFKRIYKLNIERFKEEYLTVASLNHINIARVFKIGIHNDNFYIVSEFVEGEPIAKYVRGWNPTEMIPLFVQFLNGLDYIHRNGLIHLDIKSQNILVQEIDGKPIVKIIDFGLAMAPEEYRGAFIGTIGTMAPEVALGLKEKVDSRADLYSAGMVMYYCVTWGFYPFSRPKHAGRDAVRHMIEKEERLALRPPSYAHESRSAPDKAPFVPPFLDDIIMRLISYHPENRFYGNARAAVNALNTKAPDLFKNVPEDLKSYLIPEGDAHVGREKEQAQLYGSVEGLSTGKSSFFAITGIPGSGKTHLLEKVKQKARRLIESTEIIDITFPTDDASFDIWRARLTSALAENSKSLLVIYDNLHLASDLQMQNVVHLFEKLFKRQGDEQLFDSVLPVMICVGAENLDRDAFSFLNKIELRPFSRDEIKTYLASTPALKNQPIPDKWVSMLSASTQGIPRELAEHLREQDAKGLLFSPEGSILMAGDLGKKHAPTASTRERLELLYGRATPLERAILDFLAVWHWKKMTRNATYADINNFFYSDLTLQSINGLLAKEILCKFNGAVEWRNDYFPNLVYESIEPSERRQLHDGIAKYLKTDRDSVALHLAFGSDKKIAIKNCLTLGRKLLRIPGKATTARELLEFAETIEEQPLAVRIYTRCLLMDALYLTGMHSKIDGLFDETMVLIGALGKAQSLWRVELIRRIVPYYIKQRNYARAGSLLEDALGSGTEPLTTSQKIILLNYRARIFYEQSFEQPENSSSLLSEAKKIYEESNLLAADSQLSSSPCATGNHLGLVLRTMGNYEEAWLKLNEKLNHPHMDIFEKITTKIALMETYRLMGKYDLAIALGQEIAGLSLKLQEPKWLVHIHETIANTFHDSDKFEDALHEASRALAITTCMENDVETLNILNRLHLLRGHCYKELKAWDKASTCFTKVIDSAPQAPYLASAYEGMAEVDFMTGSFDRTADHLEKTDAILKNLPKNLAHAHVFRLIYLQIKLYAAKNKHDEAKKLLPKLLAAAQEKPDYLKEYAEIEKMLATTAVTI